MTMKKTLNEVLERAHRFGKRWDLPHRASLKLEYFPADDLWQASASWGNQMNVVGTGHVDPEQALVLLRRKIMDYSVQRRHTET
jgi:hypothetical protein